jgi:hypothetical protein
MIPRYPPLRARGRGASPATRGRRAPVGTATQRALWFGLASYRRTIRQVEAGQCLRVAAISVYDPFDGCPGLPAYRDVEARIGKYQPLVVYAAAQGARLIVLPEHAAIMTAQTRRRWPAAVSQWAQ